MDDSTRACELQSTFAIENPPKLIRMDWCMPWSHRGYKRGQDWNLKRFYPQCNVELIWTKYVESHSVSDSPSHSTPDPNSPNEVISSYGCNITNIKTKLTFSSTNMPGSPTSTCQKLIMISTGTSKKNSTHHLLHWKLCSTSNGWVVVYH